MTNTNKKSKNTRKLLGAVGMLSVSAAMLVSSTFAWFSMNKTVTAKTMQLKATAEQGLVISDFSKSSYKTEWDVAMTTADAAVLAPTSAAAVASPAWVRNSSDDFDNAKADQSTGFEDLTLTWGTEATSTGSIGSVTGADNVTKNYVLKRTFYIKATGDTAWNENLVIDEITASVSSENTDSAELNKSLRVLAVVTDGADTTKTNAFVYAPINGATTTYNWKGTATGAVAVSAVGSTTDSTCTNITSIPAGNTTTPIKVELYMYFEGEDAACKSSNISGISVDTLSVTAKFKTTSGPADAGA